MYKEIIQQIQELNEKLTEHDVYMGGVGCYKIEENMPFSQNKNLYYAVSLKDGTKCLLEFAPADIDHVEMQKYLRRAIFLMVLDREKNVITAHDFSIDPARCFVVLDWVPGKNLQSILKHRTLSLHEALWITVDLSWALEHLAEYSFVHRNVNPKNITIKDGEGKAYLGGVENLALSDFLQTRLEINDHYVSPELMYSLLYPDTTVMLTPWSDIYSLGAIFYHMICGVSPFLKRTNLARWCRWAPVPKIESETMSRRDRKFCQHLINSTMHRKFLKRWSARQIREYVADFLSSANRQEDMARLM